MTVPKEDFFQDVVRTEKDALSFVKKLTAMSISTILYHRGMFPAQDYGVRQQSGEVLYILDRNAVTPAAKRIVDLVRSTFTAIDQKVLNKIVIGIVDDPDKPDQFLESYTIKLQYFHPQEQASGSRSGQEVAEQAVRMLQELKQVASRIKRVNKDLFFTMRLLFCEDTSFEPKGFTTKPVSVFEMKGRSEAHSCGQIRTRFSGFHLKTDTNVKLYTA